MQGLGPLQSLLGEREDSLSSSSSEDPRSSQPRSVSRLDRAPRVPILVGLVLVGIRTAVAFTIAPPTCQEAALALSLPVVTTHQSPVVLLAHTSPRTTPLPTVSRAPPSPPSTCTFITPVVMLPLRTLFILFQLCSFLLDCYSRCPVTSSLHLVVSYDPRHGSSCCCSPLVAVYSTVTCTRFR